MHPSTPAAFDANGHGYTYALTGEESAMQVRLMDSPAPDNSGRVQIFLLPGA